MIPVIVLCIYRYVLYVWFIQLPEMASSSSSHADSSGHQNVAADIQSSSNTTSSPPAANEANVDSEFTMIQ